MTDMGTWVRENYCVVDPPLTPDGKVHLINPETGELLYFWPEGGFIPVQLQALYNGRPERTITA